MRLIVCLIAKLTDWLAHKDLPAFWLAGGVCVLLVVPPASNVGHSLSTPARQLPEQRGAKGEFQKSSIWMFYNKMLSSNQHIQSRLLQEFLLKIFCVFRNLMKLSIFPRDWNVMRLLTSKWESTIFSPFFSYLLPSRTILHYVTHCFALNKTNLFLWKYHILGTCTVASGHLSHTYNMNVIALDTVQHIKPKGGIYFYRA